MRYGLHRNNKTSIANCPNFRILPDRGFRGCDARYSFHNSIRAEREGNFHLRRMALSRRVLIDEAHLLSLAERVANLDQKWRSIHGSYGTKLCVWNDGQKHFCVEDARIAAMREKLLLHIAR